MPADGGSTPKGGHSRRTGSALGGLLSSISLSGILAPLRGAAASGKEMKLGTESKFYYDEKLGMWREEGVDAVPDLSPPPPPPTTLGGNWAGGGAAPPPPPSSGAGAPPPGPAPRAAAGGPKSVRARYVDTFSHGAGVPEPAAPLVPGARTIQGLTPLAPATPLSMPGGAPAFFMPAVGPAEHQQQRQAEDGADRDLEPPPAAPAVEFKPEPAPTNPLFFMPAVAPFGSGMEQALEGSEASAPVEQDGLSRAPTAATPESPPAKSLPSLPGLASLGGEGPRPAYVAARHVGSVPLGAGLYQPPPFVAQHVASGPPVAAHVASHVSSAPAEPSVNGWPEDSENDLKDVEF